MQVRRMTIGSEGELAISEGRKVVRRPISVRYTHDGEPAALGYELDVDGVVITGHLDEVSDSLRDYASTPAWRTAAFRQLVLQDPGLDGIANSFQRAWLVEVYKHAHVSYGLDHDDLAASPTALSDGRWAEQMTAFFAASYRAELGDIEDARLLTTLRELATDPRVRGAIERHGRLLVADDPAAVTGALLDRVFADTLGAALLTAVQECVPDAQENDLAVDIELDCRRVGSRSSSPRPRSGGLASSNPCIATTPWIRGSSGKRLVGLVRRQRRRRSTARCRRCSPIWSAPTPTTAAPLPRSVTQGTWLPWMPHSMHSSRSGRSSTVHRRIS